MELTVEDRHQVNQSVTTYRMPSGDRRLRDPECVVVVVVGYFP